MKLRMMKMHRKLNALVEFAEKVDTLEKELEVMIQHHSDVEIYVTNLAGDGYAIMDSNKSFGRFIGSVLTEIENGNRITSEFLLAGCL